MRHAKLAPARTNRILSSAQHFRASLLACTIVIGAPVGGICGLALVAVSDFVHGSLSAAILAVVAAITAAALLAYFPGNLNVLLPCAVDIHPGTEIILFGPLKKLHIPISDLSCVQDSFVWQGQAVILRKSHRLLGQAKRTALLRGLLLANSI